MRDPSELISREQAIEEMVERLERGALFELAQRTLLVRQREFRLAENNLLAAIEASRRARDNLDAASQLMEDACRLMTP